MHYGELNPAIRILAPEQVAIKAKLFDYTGESYGVYAVSFGGRDAVMKIPIESTFGNEQANALHLLQGLPCVPELYGVVNDYGELSEEMKPLFLWMKKGVESSRAYRTHDFPYLPEKPEGAIVEEVAPGRPLWDLYERQVEYLHEYRDPSWHGAYRKLTGVNLLAKVAAQVAGHFMGSLERGFVDCDFRSRDIFLDAKPGGSVRVTKVDTGYVQHVRDRDYGQPEIIPHKFNSAILHLISLFPQSPYADVSWSEVSDCMKRLGSTSSRLKAEGLIKAPDLMNAYLRDDFNVPDNPTKGKNFPDDRTFLQFLDLWKNAMEEDGEFLARQA